MIYLIFVASILVLFSPRVEWKSYFLVVLLASVMSYFFNYKTYALLILPSIYYPIIISIRRAQEDITSSTLRKYRVKVYMEKVIAMSLILFSFSYLVIIFLNEKRTSLAQESILEMALKLKSESLIFLSLILVSTYFYLRKAQEK